MASSSVPVTAGVKRKREGIKEGRKQVKEKRRAKSPGEDDAQATILELESQIVESRRHFNNIATLLQLAKKSDGEPEGAILAAVALCRIFSRLLAAGDMVKSRGLPQSEIVIVQWLKERYKDYLDTLLMGDYLRSDIPSKQSVALTLLMRLAKEESQASEKDYHWKHGPLSRVLETILLLPKDDSTRDEFVEKYLKQYDDIRYYTFQTIAHYLDSDFEESVLDDVSANSLSMLLTLDTIPTSKSDLENFYLGTPKQSTSPLHSLSSHKSQAQAAWLVSLRRGLDKEQRKTVLRDFSHRIAPWFQQPEMLMDFLTDSYNVGGATSLLALSGLYYLMSERNLDYPSFYQKLYSLLDDGLLHSKHRSRFFRLLDTFMASTHLPATMVASFIKRLARLALNGPPAGIVVVVPWIYNMFKRHPACTFMIHREIRDPAVKKQLEAEGMDDPFDMEEEDPMLTEAIESSLWEIESLQSHYHPNVATLAKIISEQFTKRSYNLEDFLDHSYTALLDNELNRELKKEPVVEFEIPKRIFTADDGELGLFGQLMSQVIEPT